MRAFLLFVVYMLLAINKLFAVSCRVGLWIARGSDAVRDYLLGLATQYLNDIDNISQARTGKGERFGSSVDP